MTTPAGPLTGLTAVAGRSAVRPCPLIGFIRPCQNTHATSGKCQGHGVRFGAPVNTGEQEGVNVADDEANLGGQVDTWDIIKVVARTCMKPNDLYATWWR
jgi:hypothetical protein